MRRPIGLGAAAVVVSASVLLSRLLGLGREALLAALIGVGGEGDLYRQAFSIPDFLNYLLAGAYLTITLVPILSRHAASGDTEAANRAFTSVFRFVGLAIIILTALMWLAADPLVSLIFPEATEHSRLVSLTRLVLPAQVFLVAGAMLMAVQYTHRRFLYPALAPLVYNLGIIAGGLVGAAQGSAGPEGFLWGAVIGSAVGNFGLQWLGVRATGTRLTRVPKGGGAVGEYLTLALPLMLGQSIAVLDEQFVRWFGQVEVGATAALSFARQLNMVPVGVVAQAAGVAAFPFLARLAASGDLSGLTRTTGRAVRSTVFAATGAAAMLMAVAGPVVRLLYRYGRFTDADAAAVSGLLTIYALSIPAWAIHQILTRHFYARRRMWTPVLIGTVGTALAVPVWIWGYRLMGVAGLATASVTMMTLYALALGAAYGRDAGWAEVRRLLPSILRSLAAGVTAVLVAVPVVRAVESAWGLGPGPGLTAMIAGALSSLAVFALVDRALGGAELGELLRRDRPD